MYQRIKEIRQSVKKTQKEFGESLGVSRDVYANIENARVEPSKTFIQLLCAEYKINEGWLRTGEGEMLVETKQSFVKRLADEYGLNFFIEKIIESYLRLEGEQLESVNAWCNDIAEAIRATPASETVSVLELLEKRTAFNQSKAANSVLPNMEAAEGMTFEEEAAAYADNIREQVYAQVLLEKKLESKVSFAPESGVG